MQRLSALITILIQIILLQERLVERGDWKKRGILGIEIICAASEVRSRGRDVEPGLWSEDYGFNAGMLYPLSQIESKSTSR